MRRVNLDYRPIKGGFIKRVWLGDVWAWESYDADKNRLRFTASTAREATARVASDGPESLKEMFRL